MRGGEESNGQEGKCAGAVAPSQAGTKAGVGSGGPRATEISRDARERQKNEGARAAATVTEHGFAGWVGWGHTACSKSCTSVGLLMRLADSQLALATLWPAQWMRKRWPPSGRRCASMRYGIGLRSMIGASLPPDAAIECFACLAFPIETPAAAGSATCRRSLGLHARSPPWNTPKLVRRNPTT